MNIKRSQLLLLIFFPICNYGQQAVTDSVNQEKITFNDSLRLTLDSIFKTDQAGRRMIDSIQLKFSSESTELMQLLETISFHDSINLQKIERIIAQYGWPGKSLVGDQGNRTVFLVVQHAAPATQKKYLPLLKASVLKSESKGAHLAYLEDRILMRDGKPQIYGTQIVSDQTTGKWKIYTIADEKLVDVLWAKIGLQPLAEYVKPFGITYKGVQ